MLTIATMVRPFEGEFLEIQRNCLLNWVELSDDVILVGDTEAGAADMAKDFECRLLPCRRNAEGVKLVNDVIKVVMENAREEWILFTGAETRYTSKVGLAINGAIEANLGDNVLIVGQRHDVLPGKPPSLRHGGCIEYFLFHGDPWGDLPEFAAGRPGYDNCLVWKAVDNGVPVIDATAVIRAMHQDHGSRHRTGVLAKRNRKTMHEECGYAEVKNATYAMDQNGRVTRK